MIPAASLAEGSFDEPPESTTAVPADSNGEKAVTPLELVHPYGFHQIGLDARYLVTRPAHLDRNGIIKIALTAGTTGILYLYRKDIRDWVQDHTDPGSTQIANDARVMGKGAFAPTLALIAYGASFATKNPREKETAVLLLESMGFTAIATGIGQAVLATQRPDEGDDINYFARRGHGVSGDAALAASVVPILSRQYLTLYEGDGPGLEFWKLSGASMLYAGAFLTGYQRLAADKHWAPDVFLGLVTGFSVGQMLCDSHRSAGRQSSIHVDFSTGAGALQARITF